MYSIQISTQGQWLGLKRLTFRSDVQCGLSMWDIEANKGIFAMLVNLLCTTKDNREPTIESKGKQG